VAQGQEIAVIDIASAQWRFGRLSTLDRVDLKLKPGAALADAKAQLSQVLPASAQISEVGSESRRGDALSRAYRVNLDMLALVALLTGGFSFFSAQSLAVTRRLRQFALLRTLGNAETCACRPAAG
jgi:putative ABC transport system permease protein